ncbi:MULTISPECIES: hypothetical protein [unclassified Streptomyces]|uniref:hypothetical protein n=1 Tax=unclassified Streptomyces TaxID=2593676 RepID=UPI000B88B81D|nr:MULTISPECIES: hypothetical protein [unclassified Streptomyces]MYZ33931.1 hypothetical protein [Streptomyces sp. SID4917]
MQREGDERVSEAGNVELGAAFANDAKFLSWFVHREPFRWLGLREAAELAKTRMHSLLVVMELTGGAVEP